MAGPPWRALVEDPEPGSHIIFWYDGARNLYAPLHAFLHGAFRRGDVVFLALAGDAEDRLRTDLRADGISLDAAADEGSLIRADPRDLVPRDLPSVENLGTAIENLALHAERARGRGLSMVGQVGFPVFDRGDALIAEGIERVASEKLGDARMLCLYDRAGATLDRYEEALAVTRRHTHSVTALAGDRFVVEPVPPRRA